MSQIASGSFLGIHPPPSSWTGAFLAPLGWRWNGRAMTALLNYPRTLQIHLPCCRPKQLALWEFYQGWVFSLRFTNTASGIILCFCTQYHFAKTDYEASKNNHHNKNISSQTNATCVWYTFCPRASCWTSSLFFKHIYMENNSSVLLYFQLRLYYMPVSCTFLFLYQMGIRTLTLPLFGSVPLGK